MRPRLTALLALVLLAALAGQSPAGGVSHSAAQATSDPAVGDAVTFLRDPDAGSAAGTVTITVNQVVDPFAAFGPTVAPAGRRYVYVGLTIANDGETPLVIDPASFFVQDADGVVARPIDPFAATPAAAADRSFTVAAGATEAGGVVFAVREDAVLARLFHDPAPDRLILLASFAAPAGAEPTPTPPPAAVDATATVAGDTPTPAAAEDEATGTATAADISCDGFQAYYDETTERIDRLAEVEEELADLVNTLLANPTGAATTLEGLATEFEGLAADQRDATVPAGAEALNDRIVAMFETYAEGLGQLASGLAAMNPAALQGAIPLISEADELSREVAAQLDAAAAACGIPTDQ